MGIKTMPVPLDPRYEQLVPMITNSMKAYCIGEFSWEEEAPFYDENGNIIQSIATRTVPWDLCKRIYQQMATMANASPELDQASVDSLTCPHCGMVTSFRNAPEIDTTARFLLRTTLKGADDG
ncbi:hypothetical protein HMF8227_02329 [Saliniradius amylolyticus]|uniref:Uncharacterized protein n=1 Tax=Saliniradius amylolyticus TaxID=2183582 RepID=A0A2S2E547_9ALTE|nr:hypothetical protein HMF8227_02329 [Saliniradius amylolyticus]